MATPNETNSGPSGESATLLHTALFKQVSSEEAEELLPHLQHAEYSKGDYIFREGDTDHRMYLLERGRVKLIRQSSDRRVQLLSIHAYGEVLGEIPVFDPHGGPRTASAVAMTSDTKVVWLEHDALFAWLDEHPRVAVDMLQVLAHRTEYVDSIWEDIKWLTGEEPSGGVYYGSDYFETCFNCAVQLIKDGKAYVDDLTQEEMAQLVGSSRETVNKALMDFANRGWIAREGRSIIIYQPGMLIRRSRR